MFGAKGLPKISTGKDLITVSTKMMTEKKDAETKPTGVLNLPTLFGIFSFSR